MVEGVPKDDEWVDVDDVPGLVELNDSDEEENVYQLPNALDQRLLHLLHRHESAFLPHLGHHGLFQHYQHNHDYSFFIIIIRIRSEAKLYNTNPSKLAELVAAFRRERRVIACGVNALVVLRFSY